MAYFQAAHTRLLRVAALTVALVLSLGLSYGVTRIARDSRTARGTPADSAAAAVLIRRSFPTGTHLLAYVLLSHRCGFCTEEGTKRALRNIRPSLMKYQNAPYAKVSVVGVALDADIDAGFEYLEDLNEDNAAFDELSVGGSWLNHFVTQLVWRGGMAEASTPSIVVVARNVDATAYPSNIGVGADSFVTRISGRRAIINWVTGGTPLPSVRVSGTAASIVGERP